MNYKLIPLLLLFAFNAYSNFNFSKDFSFKLFDERSFKTTFTKDFFAGEDWPNVIFHQDREYRMSYTIDEELTSQIKSELKRYRSDYTSVVVVDNNSGKVLAAVDYHGKTKRFGKKLSFSSVHPAASIFKVITAADLLENTELRKSSNFSFNGKPTTLYKYQLKNKKNRWTRTVPFSRAFATSNNVVFGKAAIKNSNYESLLDTAGRFGFNSELLQMISVDSSSVFEVESRYNLAELASGFNRSTLISPLHGAVIASVVANEGVFKHSYLVENVEDVKHERVVWKPNYTLSRAISQEAARELQAMMDLTVKRGTARGAFRSWHRERFKKVDVGGKTGSITGGEPFGKRDWFVSYIKPQNNENDKGISICVMIVNVEKWHVKSTYLAEKIMRNYYNSLSF